MARRFLGSLALIGTVAAHATVDVEMDGDYADALTGVEFIEDLVAEASADWTEATADAMDLDDALKVVEDVDQLELAELPPKSLSPEMLAALAKLKQKAERPSNSKPAAAPSRDQRKFEEFGKEIVGAVVKGAAGAARSSGGGSLDGLMKIGKLLGAKGGAGARPAGGMPGDMAKLKALGKMFGAQGAAGARPAGGAAGGAAGADKLKALGKMLGGQGGAGGAGNADKLKALGKMLGGQGGAAAAPAGGSANAFLKTRAKSAAEMGPAEQQAALEKVKASVGPAQAQALQKMADNVMASTAQKITQAIQSAAAASSDSPLGDGAKKIQEKLAKVITDEPEPGAVEQLEAAVNKKPSETLISQLTKMKEFLETKVASDPKYSGLRSLLAGADGVMRLAKFSEAASEAMNGFKANGPMWGTTDAGFAATARLVQAAEATDGKAHEAFSASGALALKKYLRDHPDEAKGAFRGLLPR